MFTQKANEIFQRCIEEYHVHDDINYKIDNPYDKETIEHLLFLKNWIDTVQWHFEDIIRDPNIDPVEALSIKRRIDFSNQERTDTVEYIDSYFMDKFKNVTVSNDAKVNTETPAWAIDRLSILALKIYHMEQEVRRTDVSDEHINNCRHKLDVLLAQRVDLSMAIDELLCDIENGTKYMKVYKQMKMYNDPDLNPVLYANK